MCCLSSKTLHVRMITNVVKMLPTLNKYSRGYAILQASKLSENVKGMYILSVNVYIYAICSNYELEKLILSLYCIIAQLCIILLLRPWNLDAVRVTSND